MRLRTRTAYAFLTPYMLVFLAFWIWPIINSFWLSFLNTQDRHLDVQAKRHLGPPPRRSGICQRAQEHADHPRHPGAGHDRAGDRAWRSSEFPAAQGARPVPLRFLRAGGGRRGRLRRGVPSDVQSRVRHRQQDGGRGRPSRDRLARQPECRDGGDHHRAHLALGGIQRDHHPRRTAVDPRGCLRGGNAGRRLEDTAVLLHHAAAAEACHRCSASSSPSSARCSSFPSRS